MTTHGVAEQKPEGGQEMDLPVSIPRGLIDGSRYVGTHGCGHEGCAEWLDLPLCWCQQWIVLEYCVFDEPWDTESWWEKLKTALPKVHINFTGVSWSLSRRANEWFYLVYVRVNPVVHRVDEDMLRRLRRLGEQAPGVHCMLVQTLPHCCSKRRSRGKNLRNLYVACHEEDEVLGTRSLFGDEYTRGLLKLVWAQVDERIRKIEAEEAENPKNG
jgi:hypothetical protein